MWPFLACYGMLLAAEELPLADFTKLPVEKWTVFSGEGIRKTAEGIQVIQPGVTGVKIPGNWASRTAWENKFNGVKFKVKGNGSKDYGCFALIVDVNFPFVIYYPLEKKEWQEYTAHFDDFVFLGTGIVKLNRPEGALIENLSRLRFGDRWTIIHNNAKRTSATYEISNIMLVSNAVPRLNIPNVKSAPLAEKIRQLKEGKGLNILCLGDSITAGTSLRKPDGTRYADLIAPILMKKYGFRNVTSQSLGVGGATSYEVLPWIDRDFRTIPDVVTLTIGFNDWTHGVTPEAFRENLNQWVTRVSAKTAGKTAIILMTSLPGAGPRYQTQDAFAQVVREVAAKRKIACFDLNAVIKKLGKDKIGTYYADVAHPNERGHELIAEAIADFIRSVK